MKRVAVDTKTIDAYVESSGAEAVDDLRRLAAPLRGLRVLHVNATPVGGGVAEILQSEIPLLRDLGIDAEWRVIDADAAFFEVTKTIHNALQSAPHDLTAAEQGLFAECQEENAARLEDAYDLIVVHDPQPVGLLRAAGGKRARWVWRLHVDSSRPHPPVWSFLRPYLDGYDAHVFTLAAFVPEDVPRERVRLIPPAIDPLTIKNRPMPHTTVLDALRRIGLDPARPLVAQVSRLDPWKDPQGVIDAYRLVRRHVPGLQLALLGVIEAKDDPEADRIAHAVRAHADNDPDIHIYTEPTEVGPPEVAAVQQGAQVIFQKSLKEGFALTVTEALWKATPVVGGRVGGIPLQLEDGIGGFLVESGEEAAERTRWLLENPPEARVIGARGRERIRERFLTTRLLADELRLYAEVLRERRAPDVSTHAAE